tara:strand:+ start:15090 stop:15581 length:492 start_codon:yes stop_codon:yes gene_type:complete
MARRKRLAGISRSEIREAIKNIKQEESAEECVSDTNSADIRPSQEWRSEKIRARKEKMHQMRQASRELDSIVRSESVDEVTHIVRQNFISEGDMVTWRSRPQIIREGEDHAGEKFGLVLETEDYVHERYPSGTPKRITKCHKVTVLVGSTVEVWPAKAVNVCE